MEKEILNNQNNNVRSINPFNDYIAFQVNKNTFGFTVNDALRNIHVHSLTITTDRIIIKTDEENVEIYLYDCENAFEFVKQIETGLVSDDQFIRPQIVHTITEYLNKYPKSIEKILLYFKQLDCNPKSDKNENIIVDDKLKIEDQNRNHYENKESSGFSTFKQHNESKITSLRNHILTYGTRINKNGKRVINTEFIYPNRFPNSEFAELDDFRVFVKHDLFKSCSSLLEMLFTFPVYERSELIRLAIENAVAHLIDHKIDVNLEGIPFFLSDDNAKRTWKDDIETDDLINTTCNYICNFGIKQDEKGNRVLDSKHVITSNNEILVNSSFFEKDISLLAALGKLPNETTEIVLKMVFDAFVCEGVKRSICNRGCENDAH